VLCSICAKGSYTTATVFQPRFCGTSGFRKWLPGLPLKLTEFAWDKIHNHSSMWLQQYIHLYLAQGSMSNANICGGFRCSKKVEKHCYTLSRQLVLLHRKLLWNHPWILFQNLFNRTILHDAVRIKWSVYHSSIIMLVVKQMRYRSAVAMVFGLPLTLAT